MEMNQTSPEFHKEKICPLTGRTIASSPWNYNSWCMYEDCGDVSEETVYYLNGHSYRCPMERQMAENEIARAEKQKRLHRAYEQSLNQARMLDPDKFWDHCRNIDKEMMNGRMECSSKVRIPVFLDTDQTALIYFFSADQVIRITVSDNPASCIGSWLQKLTEYPDPGISLMLLPKEGMSEINLTLHIIHRLDTKGVYSHDNAFLVKEKGITSYLSSNYGISWHDFNRIRNKHLELTEYHNLGNTFYVKKELDDVIREEYRK